MINFSCPGKVFLLGEYSVIEGGRSLVGAVGPLFNLKVTNTNSSIHEIPFAKESPAGLLLQRYDHLVKGMHLTWTDPYKTPIGVGASAAQFVMSLALVRHLEGKPLISAEEVLETYWATVGTTQGLRPSGADVVAQFAGGFILFRNEPFHCEALPEWNTDVSFILAFTGSKTKTHEHLMQLRERGFPFKFSAMLQMLDTVTLQAVEYWRTHEIAAFGQCLNRYQNILNEFIASPDEYRQHIQTIQTWPGVLGAKGAGAQGGDSVLIMTERSVSSRIEAAVRTLGWEPYPLEWADAGLQTEGI